MNIGTLTINSSLALAPMAGVTDVAFRQICAELGAGYTITELISSKALCYHDKKTLSLLQQFPGEHPAAVQIFGSDPVCMAEAAQIALEHSGADVVDLNMGCPMGKIVNNGDGAALMKDPEKAGRIMEAVVAGTWAAATAWSSPESWSRQGPPPWRSTAGPGPRCTAVRRTGPAFGR